MAIIKFLTSILLLPLKWIIRSIGKSILKWRLELKVKEAVRRSKVEDRRYIVTTFFGRPQVYSKRMLKEAVKRRKFKKGVTIQDIEKSAYFVTR